MRRPKISGTLYCVTVLLMLLLIWAWCLLEQTTNVRVSRIGFGKHKAAAAAKQPPLSIYYPLVATPLIAGCGYFLYRRQVDFVRHAELVMGRISSIGSISAASMRDVSYEFTYQDQTYRNKKSLTDVVVKDLEEGQSVEVLVSPKNPQRNNLMMDYLFFEEVDKSN